MQKNEKEKGLDEVLNLPPNSSELEATKEIHRKYNLQNGFIAILEIYRKYKIITYFAIVASVLISAYSFNLDFSVAFPMVDLIFILIGALGLSILLEFVRDVSAIALFNVSMNGLSRILVSLFFIGTTFVLFNSHFKAIGEFEKQAIEYDIKNSDLNTSSAKMNPQLSAAKDDLTTAKADLEAKRAELTPKLIENTTSQFRNKRKDSIAMKANIESDIKILKLDVKMAQKTVTDLWIKDNKEIANGKKAISFILLSIMILIEFLAMLGAVAKFVVLDNSSKEISKHSEIVNETISIGQQLRANNKALQNDLAESVKVTSQINRSILESHRKTMLEQNNFSKGLLLTQQVAHKAMVATVAKDMQESSKNILLVLEMMTKNKQAIMMDVNRTLETMANIQIDSMVKIAPPKTQPKEIFRSGVLTELKIVEMLYGKGKIKKGKKLVSKSSIINIKDRSEDMIYKSAILSLKNLGAISEKKGFGYYAVWSYEDIIKGIQRSNDERL